MPYDHEEAYHVPLYVQTVLDRFDDYEDSNDGWVSSCPVPSHGDDGKDSTPSLRIAVVDDGRIVFKCRVGCHTDDVISAVGLSYNDLRPPKGEEPAEPTTSKGTSSHEVSWSEASLRDTVYNRFLELCPVDPSHHIDLKKRGFDDEIIRINKYGSIRGHNNVQVAQQLLQEFGPEKLFSVPGFVCGTYFWRVAADPGLLIPVRNYSGHIIAIKIRRDSLYDAKYKYLTSPNLSPHNPVHVPLCASKSYENIVLVTEGELKADAVVHMNGWSSAVSIPGVTNWHNVFHTLEALKPLRVIVAFDWPDVQSKVPVRQQCRAFFNALTERGYNPSLLAWKGTAKGVDDALLAKSLFTSYEGIDAISLLDQLDGLPSMIKTPDELPGTRTPNLPPSPRFPTEAFPQPARAFIEWGASTLQCPPDFLGAGVLGAASRAIGMSRSVLLNIYNYQEICNLYLVVVARPGKLKTAALNAAMRPILKRQSVITKAYKKALALNAAYHVQMKAHKHHQKMMIPDPGDPTKEIEVEIPNPGVEPPAPGKIENIHTGNATTEGLSGCMQDNSEKGRGDSAIIYYADEINGMFKLMNAYRGGHGADREFFLEAWSGKSLKVDRKGAGSINVEHPFLSILGSIQPEVLGEMQQKHKIEDGFAHRFLYHWPDDPRPYDAEETDVPRFSNLAPHSTAVLAWEVAINLIMDHFKPGADGGPVGFEIAPTAWFTWLDAGHAHARQMYDATTSEDGYLSKSRAIMARLMVILHVLKRVGFWMECSTFEADGLTPGCLTDLGYIDEDTVRAAEKLTTYYVESYSRVQQGVCLGPEDRLVAEFVAWVDAECDGSVSARDVYHSKKFGCHNKDEGRALLRKAEARDYGKILSWPDSRNRKRERFVLNEFLPKEEQT